MLFVHLQMSYFSPKTLHETFTSEYTARFLGEKYKLDNLKPVDKVYENPWDLENLVKADLDQARTKIDLRTGALPKYGGYVPGYKSSIITGYIFCKAY